MQIKPGNLSGTCRVNLWGQLVGLNLSGACPVYLFGAMFKINKQADNNRERQEKSCRLYYL